MAETILLVKSMAWPDHASSFRLFVTEPETVSEAEINLGIWPGLKM
jgi:hypothetical protein